MPTFKSKEATPSQKKAFWTYLKREKPCFAQVLKDVKKVFGPVEIKYVESDKSHDK